MPFSGTCHRLACVDVAAGYGAKLLLKLAVELIDLSLAGELKARQQVVAAGSASLILKGQAAVVPLAGNAEDCAAIACSLVACSRDRSRADDGFTQIKADDRATTRQDQAADSCRVEALQPSSVNRVVAIRREICVGVSVASSVVNNVLTWGKHDRHQLLGHWDVGEVVLAGDQARFNDSAANRLERSGLGVAANQPLAFNAADFLVKAVVVLGGVTAQNNVVFTGIWIDVKNKRRVQRVVDLARTSLYLTLTT